MVLGTNFSKVKGTSTNHLLIYIYIYIPGALMTSILKVQSSKARPFTAKKRGSFQGDGFG